mgnify:FL=1
MVRLDAYAINADSLSREAVCLPQSTNSSNTVRWILIIKILLYIIILLLYYYYCYYINVIIILQHLVVLLLAHVVKTPIVIDKNNR